MGNLSNVSLQCYDGRFIFSKQGIITISYTSSTPCANFKLYGDMKRFLINDCYNRWLGAGFSSSSVITDGSVNTGSYFEIVENY